MDRSSNVFRKYVISFQLKDELLYTVWGDDSGMDKLVCDNNKIVVARSISKLLDILNDHGELLFDEQNFKKWLNTKDVKDCYHIYLLDTLIEKLIIANEDSPLGEDLSIELLHTLNIIGDYAYQVKDKKLMSFIQANQIKNTIDKIYDESNVQVMSAETTKLIYKGISYFKTKFLLNGV